MMEDFQSETDSDYTSYWRDWVRWPFSHFLLVAILCFLVEGRKERVSEVMLTKIVNLVRLCLPVEHPG